MHDDADLGHAANAVKPKFHYAGVSGKSALLNLGLSGNSRSGYRSFVAGIGPIQLTNNAQHIAAGQYGSSDGK